MIVYLFCAARLIGRLAYRRSAMQGFRSPPRSTQFMRTDNWSWDLCRAADSTSKDPRRQAFGVVYRAHIHVLLVSMIGSFLVYI